MTIQLDPFQRVAYLPVSVTIVPDFSTRNEGETVTFTLTVQNAVVGSIFYVKLQGVTGSLTDKDFVTFRAMSGDFIASYNAITGNTSFTSQIAVILRNDLNTEGTESFRAIVRINNSSTGTIVATSNTVTILDTSISRVITGPTAGTWTNVLGANDVRWADNGMLAWSHRNQDTSYTTGANDYAVSIFTRSGETLTLVRKLGIGASYSTSCDFNSAGTLFAHNQAGGLTTSRGFRVFSRSGDTFTQIFANNSSLSFSFNSSTIRFNPQGTRLAVLTSSSLLIYSVSGTTITLLYNNATYTNGQCMTWNPAGTRLAVGFSSSAATVFYRIYNAVTDTYIVALSDGVTYPSGIEPPVNNIKYSPDGTLLVAAIGGNIQTTPSQVGLVHWTVSGDSYTLQSRVAETGLYANVPAGTGLRNGAFPVANSLGFKPDSTKLVIGFPMPNTLDPTSTSGQDTGIAIGMWSRGGGSLTWDKSYGGIGGIYGDNGDEPVGDGSPLLKLPRVAYEISWNPAGTSIAVAVFNNSPYFRIYDLT